MGANSKSMKLTGRPGGWFNIEMPSCQYMYRKSHCGDKTILRLSYLHNGIFYIRVRQHLYTESGHKNLPFHYRVSSSNPAKTGKCTCRLKLSQIVVTKNYSGFPEKKNISITFSWFIIHIYIIIKAVSICKSNSCIHLLHFLSNYSVPILARYTRTSRDDFVYTASQWETTLHCNIVSHWLGAYTKSSWNFCYLHADRPWLFEWRHELHNTSMIIILISMIILMAWCQIVISPMHQ